MTLDLTDREAELLVDAIDYALADLWNDLADLRDRRDEHEASGFVPRFVKQQISALTENIESLKYLQARLNAERKDPDVV